ncbi:exo-alpha-sialidase [Paenibacillus cymbidii]|uniref:exo-alpha-sialidase n=1 Tax=Paenibacillus cymbidii TaxID=1639034 RepID=UPI001080778D|nr:exo-alpha-sialidase [Paenibacillus cymbidii]
MNRNSAIANSYPEGEWTKPDVERAMIFRPADEHDWTYSHHAHLAFYCGQYYAMWSNGRTNEDDVGQRVLMATSADFVRWTPAIPLVDTTMGIHNPLVLTAGGFHQTADRLVAYVGQYEYESDKVENGSRKFAQDTGHMNTRLFAVTTTDGKRFSEPIDLGLPIVPNHGPSRTASGRLVMSGNISYPYTDDPTGLSGWTMAGIYAPELAGGIVDDSESIHTVQKQMGWPVMLCEGSYYETDDRVLHMLLRSGGQKLWVTESRDDGGSWSAPFETHFPDNNAKFHFGRLPDGRFYYVGNPVPNSGRNPLVLSVSADGVRFDRHYVLCDERCERKYEGMFKGGDYGYPHTLVHDGYLHAIFSVTKEEIRAVRLPLSML